MASSVPPPAPDGYEPLPMPGIYINEKYAANHVLYGTLLAPGLVESFHVYKRQQINRPAEFLSTDGNDSEDSPMERPAIVAYANFGDYVCGHNGIVHGGIVSMLLDEVFGCAVLAMETGQMAMTADLHVNYRAPIPAGTQVCIEIRSQSQSRRKSFWKAHVTSTGSLDPTVYAEATALFVFRKTENNGTLPRTKTMNGISSRASPRIASKL